MKILFKILFASIFVFLIACSDMEDYKRYTEGGEIQYTGKANSLKIFSGHERVNIQYTMVKNPNIDKSIIYWNGRSDSVEVHFDRMAMENDTMNYILEGLKEGSYSFEIYNFDKLGYKSVPAYASGRAYGSRYITGLYDRSLLTSDAINVDNDILMTWGDSIMTCVAVQVQYTNSDSEIVNEYVGQKESSIELKKCKADGSKIKIKYRTLYKPDPTSIDTFYTPFQKIEVDRVYLADKSKFKEFRLGADTPKREGEMRFLWDGLRMTTPENYDECGWGNYLTGYNNREDHRVDKPASFTFDMGAKVNILKFRASLYWTYTNVCPQIYELYGYIGEKEPQAEAQAGEYGEPPSQWGPNWVKMASIDNSGKTSADFGLGDVVTFKKDSYNVRYLRLKCIKNWKNVGGDFSLCEVDVWGYLED